MHKAVIKRDDTLVRRQLERLGVKKTLVDHLSQKEASDLLYALIAAKESCADTKGNDSGAGN